MYGLYIHLAVDYRLLLYIIIPMLLLNFYVIKEISEDMWNT